LKIKQWLLSSSILGIVMAAGLGLVFWFEMPRTDAVSKLQAEYLKLQSQSKQQAQQELLIQFMREAASAIQKQLTTFQQRLERFAGQRPFTVSHRSPSAREKKKQEFARLSGQLGQDVVSLLLSDENGRVMAATQAGSLGTNLGQAAGFVQAKNRGKSWIEPISRPSGMAWIRVTSPCRESARNNFLGVLQADFNSLALTDAGNAAKAGVFLALGDLGGELFQAAREQTTPAKLPQMLNLTPEAFQKISSAPKATKVFWNRAAYRFSALSIPGYNLRVYGLIREQVDLPAEFSLLQNTTLLLEPGLWLGLALCFLMGSGLLYAFGGSAGKIIHKINQALAPLAKEQAAVENLHIRARGELAVLTDRINLLIDRIKIAGHAPRPEAAPITEPAATPDPNHQHLEKENQRLQQELQRLNQSLGEAQGVMDKATLDNQNLQERLEALQQAKRQLEQTLQEAQTATESIMKTAQTDQQFNKIALAEMNSQIQAYSLLRADAINNVAEDLKATLNVIKNYISSILASESGKITDAQQEFLGIVINKSARLERQITDLMDISHLESEREPFFSTVDLGAMLQDVILNIQPQADIKQIKIVQDWGQDLPVLQANSDRIGQMLVNLFQHAIKITPVGGTMAVRARQEAANAVVEIEDGGNSLSEKQAAVVFTLFHGMDSPAGPDFAGTGLKFPIMHRILLTHQGSISMKGQTPQGNLTSILLPLDPEKHFSAGVAGSTAPGLGLDTLGMITAAAGSVSSEVAQPEEESFFDLTSFMGNAEEQGKTTEPPLIQSGDDLDELLRDIENIDEHMEKK
jgi:signal transduction histidine kinase